MHFKDKVLNEDREERRKEDSVSPAMKRERERERGRERGVLKFKNWKVRLEEKEMRVYKESEMSVSWVRSFRFIFEVCYFVTDMFFSFLLLL